MNKNSVIRFSLWSWLVLNLLLAPCSGADESASVAVHFNKNKTSLAEAEKDKIRDLFHKYELGAKGRVFVVGYTDATGSKDYNNKLSRKRAHAVRREIISAFGINPSVVMAMGRGSKTPVADNKQTKGKAQNRRAEIYLVNATLRKPEREYGPNDPYFPAINILVQDADALVRERLFNDALRKLHEARALGGDHYSDWHTVYGIAGYYSGAPVDQVNAHLETAVQLDRYNFKAREFLSRVEARRKFAAGEVTKEMGRTVEEAIGVTAVAQEHEYMRLFGVEPFAHDKLDDRAVDVWQCVDQNKALVTYHFDHAKVYAWAFAPKKAKLKPQSANPGPKPSQSLPTGVAEGESSGQSAAVMETHAPVGDISENPRRIWESELFK